VIAKAEKTAKFSAWFDNRLNPAILDKFAKFMRGKTLWAEFFSVFLVAGGLIIEFGASRVAYGISDLQVSNARLKTAKLEQTSEELRQSNNLLALKVLKYITVDETQFAAALKGKPKKDVIILYPPDNEHAYALAETFKMGFEDANWTVLECRPYSEKDILPVFRKQLVFGNVENLPISTRLGVTTIGSIALIENKVSIESWRDWPAGRQDLRLLIYDLRLKRKFSRF
jgi:hypothetical protein